MEPQQMMELLLKEIRAGQVKAGADREERKAAQVRAEADRKADKEDIKTNQAELLAKLDADSKAWREEMPAMRDKWANNNHNKERSTSVEMKPEVAQTEVPNRDAVVKPVDGRNKRHRGKKQAAG
jgi:hypothetical protein